MKRQAVSRKHFYFGAAGFLFVSAYVSAAVPTAVMTIKLARDAAFAYNPDLRSTRERLVELRAVKSQAISHLFPSISASGNASHRKDAANGAAAFGGEPYNVYRLGVDLAQPLFDGGASFAALSQVRKEQGIRNYDLQIAERELTLTVVQAFYTVILNERTLFNLRKNYEIEKKVLVTAQDRYRIGRGQLLDVLQIKTQMALLDPKIAEAQKNLETSVATFANLTGVQGGGSVSLTGGLDLPLDQFQKRAPQAVTLPEIERIHLQQLQFPDIRKISLAKHYPQLSATGSWARSAFAKQDLLNGYSSAWSVGLQLSVPLFSGLSSFWEREQLASQEAQLSISEYRTVDASALNQIRAEKELTLRRELVMATKKATEYSIESLREAEKNYRLQTADYLKLLQAQQNHLDAQASFDHARYNFIVAVARYFAATGLPLDEVIAWLEKGKQSS
ncbi:MAG TPA: hypothetical protein DCS07_15195 [Bdellovibrionales bacterium]|nr:MAG: hypothetical protein A2Z97_07240 [Bdellovibrionales bacterium GWB1_52_6]OFZ04281.1 MAG: hypothetical protein A2X97_06435 [Bdellovibrionales bacterium GWA1_52_35]HAR43956.1 hypothetical protein [Bdellovibrionales bacterium]HCM40872.1 hypothetical protein [Bdellovibrionales bacterium]